MHRSIFFSLILSSAFLVSEPAHAYLDPGTGGMIMQMIIGAIAGIGVALKMYWHKIAAFFSSSKDDHPNH